VVTDHTFDFHSKWGRISDHFVSSCSSCANSVSLLVAAICEPGWHYYKDKCFKYFASPKVWEDAHSFCQSTGASLATISNDDENKYVYSDLYVRLLCTIDVSLTIWTVLSFKFNMVTLPKYLPAPINLFCFE